MHYQNRRLREISFNLVCNLLILETNSVREMAFESRVESLVSKEKSPLVTLRAVAHIVNFYRLVHFVHFC